VPYDFNAKYEAYRFLLPDARITGYPEERAPDVDALAARYPLFAVRQPLAAGPCRGCRIVGERLDLRGRHSSAELKEIFAGRVFENLFVKEVLYASPMSAGQGGG